VHFTLDRRSTAHTLVCEGKGAVFFLSFRPAGHQQLGGFRLSESLESVSLEDATFFRSSFSKRNFCMKLFSGDFAVRAVLSATLNQSRAP
jgi:hypothetical protein